MSLQNYVEKLHLSAPALTGSAGRIVLKTGTDAGGAAAEQSATPLQQPIAGAIDAGSVVSFAGNIDAGQATDVLYTVQFAQRAADGAFDRFSETRSWYSKYIEVLEALGWATEQFAFAAQDKTHG